MKAKKKEIIEILVDDLNIDYKPRLETTKVFSPKERGGNVVMLSDAAELVKNLKEKRRLNLMSCLVILELENGVPTRPSFSCNYSFERNFKRYRCINYR